MPDIYPPDNDNPLQSPPDQKSCAGLPLPGNDQKLRLRYQWLVDTARLVYGAKNLNEFFMHFTHGLESIFQFTTCMLFLPSPKNNQLQQANAFQAKSPYSEIGLSVIADHIRTVYEVFQTRRVSQIENMQIEIPGTGPLMKKRVAHLVVMPVSTGEKALGVIAISRVGDGSFEANEIDWLQHFLDYSALIVENNQLRQELRSSRDMINRLVPLGESLNRPMSVNDIIESIGQAAKSICQSEGAAVLFRNPMDGTCHLWSSGISSSYLGHILKDLQNDLTFITPENSEPIYISDIWQYPDDNQYRSNTLAEGYRAAIVYPLTYSKRLVATMECFYQTPHHWTKTEKEALTMFTHHAVLALENTRLYEEIEDVYMETVMALAKTLDARDAYTGEHSQKLAELAEATAREFHLSSEEIEVIRWAAVLHDIGKIGIPDSILKKPGPLNEEEWAVMKRHPEVGAEIISPLKRLGRVTPLIRYHQERFDGSGYPEGLLGDQIPLGARILTVIDAFGAMTSDRVYRKARSNEEAQAELQRCAGKHFDQRVVDVFCQLVN